MNFLILAYIIFQILDLFSLNRILLFVGIPGEYGGFAWFGSLLVVLIGICINFKSIFKNTLKYLNKFNNFALVIVRGSNTNSSSTENNNVLRYYGVGAQIIKELKIKKMILVSRSKKRIIALKGYGLKIAKQEIIK